MILIVEDDKTLCKELSTLLKNSGYETKYISDFRHVAEQMKQNQIR
ncbi:MAG: hypothetical protein IKI37_02460 [Oscillospiraceae bacterium]|jgi:DNA-binding response OmpR family regulator|nr:hypothetical protein [Oscillospiraceae bacterium]